MCLREAQNLMTTILRDIDNICRKNNIDYWIESGTLLGAVRHGGFIPWDDDIDISMLRDDYNKFIKIVEKELPDDLLIENMYKKSNIDYQWSKIRHKNSVFIEYPELEEHCGIFVDIFPYDYCNDKNNKMIKKKKNLRIRYKMIDYGNKAFSKPYLNNINRNSKILLGKAYRFITGDKDYKNLNNKLKESVNSIDEAEINNKITYGVEVICFNEYLFIDDIFPLKEISFENIKVKCPNNNHNCLKQFFGESYMELPNEEDRVWHNEGIYIYEYRK